MVRCFNEQGHPTLEEGHFAECKYRTTRVFHRRQLQWMMRMMYITFVLSTMKTNSPI